MVLNESVHFGTCRAGERRAFASTGFEAFRHVGGAIDRLEALPTESSPGGVRTLRFNLHLLFLMMILNEEPVIVVFAEKGKRDTTVQI
jgi:hypothetical protein